MTQPLLNQSFLPQFEGYFHQFLDCLPLGLIWLDQKGCVKKQNSLSKRLLGVSSNTIGQPWRQVIAHCLAPESKNSYEVILKNGRRLDVTTQAAPSFENPGLLEQIILLNDVTDTRRLQQQVDQEDRLRELGLISATLSHQLKTPLATALLYAEQIGQYQLTPERRTKACTEMVNQLQFMNRQINDLLFFVKGDLPVEQCHNLDELVQDLQQASKIGLGDRKLWIESSLNIECTSISCHYDAVIGALSNLVNNASEASDPGTTIVLRINRLHCAADTASGFFTFDVVDAGPGFSSQARALFGKKAFSTKKSGNGIGLRFARTVAEKHGGRLRYSPQKSGACVGISLPIFRLT